MVNKFSRYLGAIFLIPVIIFLFIGGDFLRYFLMIVSLIGLKEFYNVIEAKGYYLFKYIGYIFTVIYFVFLNSRIELIFFLIIIMTVICLSIPVFNIKKNFIESALTVFGFLYIPVMFSLISKVNIFPDGKYLVWLVFLSSWGNDTFAYYVGKFFKTFFKVHKLCPNVSPNKSIEGAIGGIIGSTLICFFWGLYLNSININIAIYHYIIIGFIGAIFAIIGDLCASSIKRYLGIKDYSNLIPGHGGILDRFDSTLFVSVTVFFYFVLVMGL